MNLRRDKDTASQRQRVQRVNNGELCLLLVVLLFQFHVSNGTSASGTSTTLSSSRGSSSSSNSLSSPLRDSLAQLPPLDPPTNHRLLTSEMVS